MAFSQKLGGALGKNIERIRSIDWGNMRVERVPRGLGEFPARQNDTVCRLGSGRRGGFILFLFASTRTALFMDREGNRLGTPGTRRIARYGTVRLLIDHDNHGRASFGT